MDALAKKLARPLDGLLREYASLQVGRATPGMLDALQVALPNGGGATVPLPTVAKVLAQSAQALSVNVFDAAAVPAVMKAIEASELGLAPEAAGDASASPAARDREPRAAMAKQVRAAPRSAEQLARRRQPAMKQAKGHASKDVAKRQEKAPAGRPRRHRPRVSTRRATRGERPLAPYAACPLACAPRRPSSASRPTICASGLLHLPRRRSSRRSPLEAATARAAKARSEIATAASRRRDPRRGARRRDRKVDPPTHTPTIRQTVYTTTKSGRRSPRRDDVVLASSPSGRAGRNLNSISATVSAPWQPQVCVRLRRPRRDEVRAAAARVRPPRLVHMCDRDGSTNDM